MTTATVEQPSAPRAAAREPLRAADLLPWALTALAFLILFWRPIITLGSDWWNDPEAGHGLLLAPLALWLGWKRGRAPLAAPQPLIGLLLITGAVLLRFVSGLAAELFTMRLSLMGAGMGLIVLHLGLRQLLHWWLPLTLLLLSIPIPDVIMGTLALPLQLVASKMGAAMLAWRHVPVLLDGNVMRLPGQTLFVTEACSGLRSLTALIALGVLVGGMWLRYPLSRVVLLALTIPVAVLLNGIRVFLTGFLVYFVSPEFGSGFLHYTEGWVIFVFAFLMLGVFAWLLLQAEGMWRARREAA